MRKGEDTAVTATTEEEDTVSNKGTETIVVGWTVLEDFSTEMGEEEISRTAEIADDPMDHMEIIQEGESRIETRRSTMPETEGFTNNKETTGR